MMGDEMSPAEVRARYRKLDRKGSARSRTEDTELHVLEAVLFNGGRIEATRDHTPPKESKFKLW